MSSFACEECGKMCADSPAGFIADCEHHKIVIVKHPQRRTSFLELLQLQQSTTNVVTRSVYTTIIRNRVEAMEYS